ncbi:hypothetical protein RN001_003710 [Aquatica leii]|uniref:Uncharacterized protein n=1 Tax=Aquatica leii TaxID=1421715 RepID=A0AAN7PIR3_9COLE|nr:hypothetical protein RN001_003710 [Aquatica leii]
MEVDSVKEMTILRNSRITPEPYIIEEQQYNYFLGFKSLMLERPFKTIISGIKIAVFSKEHFIVNYTNSFIKPLDSTFEYSLKTCGILKSVYNSELLINIKKYNNLEKLCESDTIKPIYHKEYLSLKNSGAVPDVLPESDAEDP